MIPYISIYAINTEEQDELELLDNLHQKKLKEAINIARANSDFRDEDITEVNIDPNSTLPDIMYF